MKPPNDYIQHWEWTKECMHAIRKKFLVDSTEEGEVKRSK